MARTIVRRWFIACSGILLALLAPMPASAQQPAPPPYQFVLRSRSGEAVPEHNKQGQTGGGYIDIVQRGPDTIQIAMRGAVVAGSETRQPGTASLQFLLNQDFEIIANRAGLRPPRLTLSGAVIGTLQSSAPIGGTAEQGPACSTVSAAGEPILNFCIKPHAVSTGQKLFVNDQVGPQDAVVATGGYCLQQSFALSASSPPPACHPFPRIAPSAAAYFDPDAKLDGPWTYVLHDFRSVPRRDFGFIVILHVSEAPPAAPQPLPAPRPLGGTTPPTGTGALSEY